MGAILRLPDYGQINRQEKRISAQPYQQHEEKLELVLCPEILI